MTSMFALVNKNGEIVGFSDRRLESKDNKTIELDVCDNDLINKKVGGMKAENMKVAFICNWKMQCGISTYSKFVVDALKSKVKEIKIFSEINGQPEEDNVTQCWQKGESMQETAKQLAAWKPDFVVIQHEFGIFPKATHFLKLMQYLNKTPYMVVLHSVYANHLDKTICTSAIKNIVVHSNEAKQVLVDLGHNSNIQVVPHGCNPLQDCSELWNIFQTDYAIVQFGFGFFYKGVDRAIDAVHILKNQSEKYKNIFYCYLCSESDNNQSIHNEYQTFLENKINSLGLDDNVAIIKKFNSEQIISNYLRTAKVAVFPYLTDPGNTVYAASGAIRIAMANNIPTIASESHLFDDLQNIIPRPNSAQTLADELHKIFSNYKHRAGILEASRNYIKNNQWDSVADRYLEVITEIRKNEGYLECQEIG